MFLENWKSQIIDKSASNYLKMGCKKLLKFTCLAMKFYNCHHTNLHVLLYFHHHRQMVKVIRISFYGESIQTLHPIFSEPYIFHIRKSGALFHKMPRTPFPVQINLLLNKTWVNQKICQLRKNVNYFQIIVWYLKRYLLICLLGRCLIKNETDLKFDHVWQIYFYLSIKCSVVESGILVQYLLHLVKFMDFLKIPYLFSILVRGHAHMISDFLGHFWPTYLPISDFSIVKSLF